MDIGVFGATGVIGSRVVAEAVRRGHRVRAFTGDAERVSRDSADTEWQVANWRDADSIAEAITGLDVVISAVNAGHGIAETIERAGDFVVGAHAMVDALARHPAIRVIVVGGAGSLEVAPGRQLVDEPGFAQNLPRDLGVPADYHHVVSALRDALNVYRMSNRLWTYLSPSSGRVEPGERTGRFRMGGDQLLDTGGRDISAEDLAVALLDEAALPQHIQRRFTVGY
ncbi:NAD(P)-dependent oxidoreductase [Nocardia carnea]|uniref:NAD(P)-dependent oxidoreductase n=1 Tax=Nocardia carnea TaxID=37328 RepID=UPI0024587D66|nr:NAD(P)H-binding protein [Nocardia carnea]